LRKGRRNVKKWLEERKRKRGEKEKSCSE